MINRGNKQQNQSKKRVRKQSRENEGTEDTMDLQTDAYWTTGNEK